MKRTFKGFMNKTIFNSALLALVLGMAAMDSPGHIQYIVTLISSSIVFVYALANGWV